MAAPPEPRRPATGSSRWHWLLIVPVGLEAAIRQLTGRGLADDPASLDLARQVLQHCQSVLQGEATSAVLVVAPDGRVQAAYEADRATFDEKRGGLGLALPIARRVVERHGGRVWAPVHAEERGAAIVAFPLSE